MRRGAPEEVTSGPDLMQSGNRHDTFGGTNSFIS